LKIALEDYLNLINKLKKRVPGISITTDIIVGFPGETEEDFQETLNLVKEVRFDSAYTFIYSIREGTLAAKMDGHMDYKTKHSRFQRLTDALNDISLEENNKLINKTFEVLVEDLSKNNHEVLTGRTRTGKLVHFKGEENLIGSLVDVKIDNVKTFTLEGTLV